MHKLLLFFKEQKQTVTSCCETLKKKKIITKCFLIVQKKSIWLLRNNLCYYFLEKQAHCLHWKEQQEHSAKHLLLCPTIESVSCGFRTTGERFLQVNPLKSLMYLFLCFSLFISFFTSLKSVLLWLWRFSWIGSWFLCVVNSSTDMYSQTSTALSRIIKGLNIKNSIIPGKQPWSMMKINK